MKVTICSSLSARKRGRFCFHPIGGQEAWSGGLLDGTADLVGTIKIVHFEGDDRDHVGLAKEALRVGKAGKRHARVVLIKAGMKDAGHAKSLKFGNERREGSAPLADW